MTAWQTLSLRVFFLTGTVIWGMYTVVQTAKLADLRARTVKLEVQMQDLEQKREALNKTLDSRLIVLESATFGAQKPPETTVGVQAWEKNRDKELRDRIHALELWRLNQQEKQQP